jgi:hypothetical protein
MHMKALRYIVNAKGGLRSLSDMTAMAIHKSDICGAVATVSVPYLPMDRRHGPLPFLLSDERVGSMTKTLQHRLGLCGISREVINNIVSVAIFGENWSVAHKAGSAIFEPHPMMEEFYALLHHTLSVPEPLRDKDNDEELTLLTPILGRNLVLECENLPQSENSLSFSHRNLAVQDQVVNKRLERTLRIAVLLFLNQQGRDAAMGEWACAPLLTLLTQDLRLLLADLQTPRILEISINPALLPDFRKADAMRPALIWICLVAHALQVVNNFYDADSSETRRQGGSVYRDVLLEVLGPAAEDIRLLQEDDLDVCRALDLRIIRGERWDELVALKSVLGLQLH